MKRLLLVFFTVLIASTWAIGQATTPPWKTIRDAPPMPHPDENDLASVNDIKMYYAVFNKDGKDPVILLHGAFVSSDEWGFEVPLLCKNHKVIVLDSRGHGRSTMSTQPFSYSLMASDVLQLMDHLKVQKASIVGWSDGGIIGLVMAIKYPERVNKLFTFGSNYNLSGYKSEPVDSALASRFMEKVKANYRRLSPTPDSLAVLRQALGRMYSTEPDLKPEDIKTIKAPTVIAAGQYEQFIKREHFEDLARLIPNAKLVILPNVSHGGPLQDPPGFHRAVADLLDVNK